MRAGPLANAKVISLLNRYFVPVHVSNEDYADKGPAPAEEKALKRRIYHEAAKAGLSVGTVHVYILTPDGGHPVASLHVAEAAKPDRLVATLQHAVDRFHPAPGKPVIDPAAQSAPPPAGPGALVLHLTARVLKPGGAWGEFPVENWVVYGADEVGA